MYVSSCPEGWVRRKDQNLSNGNSNNTKQNNKYLVFNNIKKCFIIKIVVIGLDQNIIQYNTSDEISVTF